MYGYIEMEETVARLSNSATRLEDLVQLLGRSMECECSVECTRLRRENARVMALLRQNPPSKPAMMPQRRLRLAAAQGWRCALCGSLLSESFHCDHKIPWSESFDDSDENIQVICYEDHMRKSAVEASCRRRVKECA